MPFLSQFTDKPIIPETCGLKFVFAFPAVVGVPDDDAYVIITSYSSVPTNVTVSVPGIGFTNTSTVSVDTYSNITLPRSVILEKDDELVNKSVLITSENGVPVCVYGISAGTGAGDAFTAFPTNVMSKRYILTSYNPVISDRYNYPSELVVTALDEPTTVNIMMNHDGHDPIEQTLRPYESFQFRDFEHDLTGTLITSSKPTSVMSGHECAYVPSDMQNPTYM